MKQQFEIYLECEDQEVTIGLTACVDSWPAEKPEMEGSTCVYPGCDAGAEIVDVYISANPDQESVVSLVNTLSGNDEFSEMEQNGIVFALDRYKGVVVDSFDADTVMDYLEAHYV